MSLLQGGYKSYDKTKQVHVHGHVETSRHLLETPPSVSKEIGQPVCTPKSIR